MLYIHKTNQLLIYCESINPKIKNKIINLDANKNHKPTLFLEKFSAVQDNSLGNIIQSDIFQSTLFLNQNGNTIRVIENTAQESKPGLNSPISNPAGSRGFIVKQGIKEFRVISDDLLIVLTFTGELIVYNSSGKEITSLKDLLSKQQEEEGWKIRGLEICPEQKFLSVMTCRVVTGKDGPEKEYDRFIFLKLDYAVNSTLPDRLYKLFSVKLSQENTVRAQVKIPFYHMNCPVLSVLEEKEDSTKFYFYIYSNGKCQKLGNSLNSKVVGIRNSSNVPGSSNLFSVFKDGLLQKINLV